MRLDRVRLRKEDNVKQLLTFFMGKNTMERQNFIIDNLVIEDDEDITVHWWQEDSHVSGFVWPIYTWTWVDS